MAALRRPFRALQFVRDMKVPVTFEWQDGKRLESIEIELRNEFGVPHGKITEAVDICGNAGNELEVTLHVIMTLDGEKQEAVPMSLVPEKELDELRKIRCLFKGLTWHGDE